MWKSVKYNLYIIKDNVLFLNDDIINYSGKNHNGIFRGKNLGILDSISATNTFTSNHGISTGLFTDLYLGDYVTIKDGTYNKDWMVAGFDTDWGIYQSNNTYDTGSSIYPYYNDDDSDADWYLSEYLKTHHVILIPKTNLFNARMHGSSTNSMGYLGSEMNYTTLPSLNNKLLNILGSHMKFHSITSTYDYDGASDTGDTDRWGVYTSLLTEEQVFGYTRYSIPESDYYPDNNKLPVFNFINAWENENAHFWLRGVGRGRSNHFVYASYDGFANYYDLATSSRGVRPRLMLI